MLFVHNLPTNLKHIVLRQVYKNSGDAEAVRNAYNSKFDDVMDSIGMENWEYSYGMGDCFKLSRNNLVFCIHVSGYYEICDVVEIAIYRNDGKEKIGSIEGIKNLEEALDIIG